MFYNYFDGLTKLFSDLYLAKDTSSFYLAFRYFSKIILFM